MSEISANVKAVAVCDASPIAIDGLRGVLGTCTDLRFAGSETSLLGAIELVRRENPAVLILDKSFGTSDVTDCLRRLRAAFAVATIVWGVDLSETEALRLLQEGASGVVHKTVSTDTLLECIRVVASGLTWMERSMLRDSERAGAGTRARLTGRELQVLELVERGFKNREIASQLGIQPGTVKIHLKNIFEKTGIHGRYSLALSGLKERGLIS